MESLIFPLLIALLAVPLFLQARKQKRAMQEQQKLQSSLQTGDRVMTTSGLYGTIVATADDSIELEIAPGLTTTWVRAAIREKVNTDGGATASDVPADEEVEAASEQSDSESKTESTSESAASESTAEAKTESKTESKAESKAEAGEPVEQQKTN
jgi:preprotein translocase subunit YajC